MNRSPFSGRAGHFTVWGWTAPQTRVAVETLSRVGNGRPVERGRHTASVNRKENGLLQRKAVLSDFVPSWEGRGYEPARSAAAGMPVLEPPWDVPMGHGEAEDGMRHGSSSWTVLSSRKFLREPYFWELQECARPPSSLLQASCWPQAGFSGPLQALPEILFLSHWAHARCTQAGA